MIIESPQQHGVDSFTPVVEQLLNRADVLASLQQMRGLNWPQASVAEPLGMAEAVAAGRGLVIPAASTALRTAFWTRVGSRW